MFFFFAFAIQISPSGNLLFVTFAQFSSVSGKVAESSPSARRSCLPGGLQFSSRDHVSFDNVIGTFYSCSYEPSVSD